MSWENILKAFGHRKPAKRLAKLFDELTKYDISYSQYNDAILIIRKIVEIIKKDKERTPKSPEEIKRLVNLLNTITDNKLSNATQEFLDYYMEDYNSLKNKILFDEW